MAENIHRGKLEALQKVYQQTGPMPLAEEKDQLNPRFLKGIFRNISVPLSDLY